MAPVANLWHNPTHFQRMPSAPVPVPLAPLPPKPPCPSPLLSPPPLPSQVVSFYSWYPLTTLQLHAAAAVAGAHWGAASAAARAAAVAGAADCAHLAPLLEGKAEDGGRAQVQAVRVVGAARVPRSFHASFASGWRRYVYLLPLRGLGGAPGQEEGEAGREGEGDKQPQAGVCAPPQVQQGQGCEKGCEEECEKGCEEECEQECEEGCEEGCEQGRGKRQRPTPVSYLPPPTPSAAPPYTPTLDVDPARVHALLATLVGAPRDYGAFARDTPHGGGGGMVCVCQCVCVSVCVGECVMAA